MHCGEALFIQGNNKDYKRIIANRFADKIRNNLSLVRNEVDNMIVCKAEFDIPHLNGFARRDLLEKLKLELGKE